MIKHIVFWNLKEENKEANALKIKSGLESLAGVIPGLIKIEVGININDDEAAHDVCLYSEFASYEDLEAYQKHPAHIEVGKFIGQLRVSRNYCDYEI